MEVHGDTPNRTVTETPLAGRAWAVLTSAVPLRLVDLTEGGLAIVRADVQLTAGPYIASQEWSRAFHEHPDAPHGIRYRSRHNPARWSVALFERCGSWLHDFPLGITAYDPEFTGIITDILNRHGFALLP